MLGYKAFRGDLTCRDMQYEIGKIYEMTDKPKVCGRGYHFCKSIADTYNYYSVSEDTRICKVEALGDIDTDDEVKYCTNKIKILEEVTEDWLRKGNASNSSSGYCNSGYRNSGNYNSGNYNSGDCNSGYRNSGNRNSGNYNSGNYNSGYYNSGYCNSGDYNSGNYNSGNYNSGYCNSDTPKVRMFNHDTDMDFNDIRLTRFLNIMSSCPYTHSEFITSCDMSQEEKDAHPEYKTIGGYIRTFVVTKEDKQKWWDEDVIDTDKEFIVSLPYFNADIFESCTDIKVEGLRSMP